VYTTIGGGSAGADPFAPQGAAETRKATLTILMSERSERPRKQGIENRIAPRWKICRACAARSVSAVPAKNTFWC